MIRVFGIIPAAGQSRRMGAAKQLLPCGDTTLLGTTIRHLLGGGLDGLCVVTRSDVICALALGESETGAEGRFITAINDDPDAEMIDSIILGVRALKDAHPTRRDDGFLVCPGDMPRIGSELIARSADAYRAAPGRIAAVVTGGCPGHPVIVPDSLSSQLESLRGRGLKHLVDQHRTSLTAIHCEDADTQFDVDTPGDYQQLKHGQAGD